MKYRFYGDELQLVKYELTVQRDYGGEQLTDTYTAVTEAEKDGLLARYPSAVVTEIDNTGYEWLNGMVFTQDQLKAGELDRAIAMGQEAYTASAMSQDEINAMLMLEIAELKAGVNNE
ncbi:MAG: hypothetical protein HFE49_04605 [Clostridia bacterium]|jgi:hypothetical protein|nr:hypothetical protein [Clostridia bacterium]